MRIRGLQQTTGEQKRQTNFGWHTYIVQGFSGSLGVPQHENTREHGLSFSKLFCRPNPCQNFMRFFAFLMNISYYIDTVEIPFISTFS